MLLIVPLHVMDDRVCVCGVCFSWDRCDHWRTLQSCGSDDERQGRDHERQERGDGRQGGDHKRQERDHEREGRDHERHGGDHELGV